MENGKLPKAKRLKNRFIGQEQEILRAVRIHGSINAMMRYDVSDYLSWTRYIDKIRLDYPQEPFKDNFLKTQML